MKFLNMFCNANMLITVLIRCSRHYTCSYIESFVVLYYSQSSILEYAKRYHDEVNNRIVCSPQCLGTSPRAVWLAGAKPPPSTAELLFSLARPAFLCTASLL